MTREYANIESPFTGGKVLEVRDIEEKIFRGEKYSVGVCYYLCEDTGEQFTTSDQDALWTSELYSQYRIKHGIPTPEEIKALRQSYGLNYAQMSRILGFGINQFKNYEDGQVPSESNGKMLRLIANPLVLLALLEISVGEFSNAEYNRIKSKIALRHLENSKSGTGAKGRIVAGYSFNPQNSYLSDSASENEPLL